VNAKKRTRTRPPQTVTVNVDVDLDEADLEDAGWVYVGDETDRPPRHRRHRRHRRPLARNRAHPACPMVHRAMPSRPRTNAMDPMTNTARCQNCSQQITRHPSGHWTDPSQSVTCHGHGRPADRTHTPDIPDIVTVREQIIDLATAAMDKAEEDAENTGTEPTRRQLLLAVTADIVDELITETVSVEVDGLRP
jgi:hypothetical protein